jgi:hypothetical protein
MKQLILILFAIISFSMPTNAQKENCQINNKAFSSGEEVNYIVSYNWGLLWVDAGAVVFKTKSAKINNKDLLHIIGAGKTFAYWDWFFKMRDIFETWVDPVDLKPVKFNRDIEDGNYYIKELYQFDRKNNLVYSESERTRKPFKQDTIQISNCTYDVLSIIYYARNINYNNYKVNETIPVSVIMDNEVFNIYFRYKGKEEKKVKDFGTFECIKFGVYLVKGDVFKEGEDMDVWITDDENKIPVLIESPILVGSIKARVVSIKGNRNELSSLKKSNSFFF